MVNNTYNNNQLHFLGKAAPEGYQAGAGKRKGFTTTAELGTINVTGEGEEEEEQFGEEEQGLFAGLGQGEEEDAEADDIFAMVDARMSSRRRGRKGREREKMAHDRSSESSTAFAAKEKAALSTLSLEQWASMPESGDFITKRFKKSDPHDRRGERYTPVPDSLLLAGMRREGGDGDLEQPLDRLANDNLEAKERLLQASLDSNNTNMNKFTINPQEYLNALPSTLHTTNSKQGKARILALLRQAIEIDPLNVRAWIHASQLLFDNESDRVSENGNGSAFDLDSNFTSSHTRDRKEAQKLMAQALLHLPDNEDIWMEAIRVANDTSTQSGHTKISPQSERDTLVDLALKRLPNSHRISIDNAKRQWSKGNRSEAISGLKKALEHNPHNHQLWTLFLEYNHHQISMGSETAESDDPNQSVRLKSLLEKATEMCPMQSEFWITLAGLSSSGSCAMRVLDLALQAVNQNASIKDTAAEEEESNNVDLIRADILLAQARLQEDIQRTDGDGGEAKLSEILSKLLISYSASTNHDGDVGALLALAVECEQQGYPKCSAGIIHLAPTAPQDYHLIKSAPDEGAKPAAAPFTLARLLLKHKDAIDVDALQILFVPQSPLISDACNSTSPVANVAEILPTTTTIVTVEEQLELLDYLYSSRQRTLVRLLTNALHKQSLHKQVQEHITNMTNDLVSTNITTKHNDGASDDYVLFVLSSAKYLWRLAVAGSTAKNAVNNTATIARARELMGLAHSISTSGNIPNSIRTKIAATWSKYELHTPGNNPGEACELPLHSSLALTPQSPQLWIIAIISSGYDKNTVNNAMQATNQDPSIAMHVCEDTIDKYTANVDVDVSKVRALLERSRCIHRQCIGLWVASCRLEMTLGNQQQALSLYHTCKAQCAGSGENHNALNVLAIELGIKEEEDLDDTNAPCVHHALAKRYQSTDRLRATMHAKVACKLVPANADYWSTLLQLHGGDDDDDVNGIQREVKENRPNKGLAFKAWKRNGISSGDGRYFWEWARQFTEFAGKNITN